MLQLICKPDAVVKSAEAIYFSCKDGVSARGANVESKVFQSKIISTLLVSSWVEVGVFRAEGL